MNVHITIHGQGRPLVMFHGWGFNSKVWAPLIPALQNRYQLHLVDLPGFGLTPYMNWQTFNEQLLQRLPLQFLLVGWSMGGLLATKLAIAAPERVVRLINVASSPRLLQDENWPGADEAILARFYENLIFDPKETLNQFVQAQGYQLGFSDGVSNLEGLSRGLEYLIQWDLRSELQQLTQPTCFMFGRLDAIVPFRLYKAMLQQYPQFNYVTFPKSAHMPFVSHPELFISHLESQLT